MLPRIRNSHGIALLLAGIFYIMISVILYPVESHAKCYGYVPGYIDCDTEAEAAQIAAVYCQSGLCPCDGFETKMSSDPASGGPIGRVQTCPATIVWETWYTYRCESGGGICNGLSAGFFSPCENRPEICGDGIDNNCNGEVDEGCDPCSVDPCCGGCCIQGGSGSGNSAGTGGKS